MKNPPRVPLSALVRKQACKFTTPIGKGKAFEIPATCDDVTAYVRMFERMNHLVSTV